MRASDSHWFLVCSVIARAGATTSNVGNGANGNDGGSARATQRRQAEEQQQRRRGALAADGAGGARPPTSTGRRPDPGGSVPCGTASRARERPRCAASTRGTAVAAPAGRASPTRATAPTAASPSRARRTAARERIICCGSLGGTAGGGAGTQCEANACPQGEYQLCTTNADCKDPNDTCRSFGDGAVKVCLPAGLGGDGGGAPPPKDAGTD